MRIGLDREGRDQLSRCGDLINLVHHIDFALFKEVGFPDCSSYHSSLPLLERGDLALYIDTYYLGTLFVFERPVDCAVGCLSGRYFSRELYGLTDSCREGLGQVKRSRFCELARSDHFDSKGLRYRGKGLGLNRNRSLLPLLNPLYLNLNGLTDKAVFVKLRLTSNRDNSLCCFDINLPREDSNGGI